LTKSGRELKSIIRRLIEVTDGFGLLVNQEKVSTRKLKIKSIVEDSSISK